MPPSDTYHGNSAIGRGSVHNGPEGDRTTIIVIVVVVNVAQDGINPILSVIQCDFFGTFADNGILAPSIS